jgi:3' exoribonuclease, RNase T-like
MAHLMIDLEGLATGPDTTILTIAAQAFDPFGSGYYDQHYYARVTLESQENRAIDDGTIAWWATQPEHAREEAFGEQDRIPLDQALDELGRLIWHSKMIWAQGPTYDCNILEHAYKSYGKALPWKYYQVRDSRTVFSLWPELPIPPTSHHALEDCRRQISMLQDTLKYLNVKELK